MDNEQIRNTVEHFKNDGAGIRVRDIAYILLSKMFVDSKIAYQCLFDEKGIGFDEYMSNEMLSKLEDYMKSEGFIRAISTDADSGGVTFEENKRAMEQMLVDIQSDMEKGLIEKKDGYARMTDIRTKLNDKFKVEAEQKDRMIVVEKKFDFICPHTRRECYQLDKEAAMEKFNLIEKPNDNGNEYFNTGN